MKQINLDALNMQLFDTIEMLKNNKDKKASENEKIDVETAKAIADLGKVIVEGYKIKAQVMNMISKTMGVNDIKAIAVKAGINLEE